jgi:hypothetical protein
VRVQVKTPPDEGEGFKRVISELSSLLSVSV